MDTPLWCRKLPDGLEFEPRLCHLNSGKLSLSNQQLMGTCSEFRKDMAGKEEGWPLPFICCAQDPVDL